MLLVAHSSARQGFIGEVGPSIAAARAGGCHYSESLVEEALRLAGEEFLHHHPRQRGLAARCADRAHRRLLLRPPARHASFDESRPRVG
jgi:hypothetical protein